MKKIRDWLQYYLQTGTKYLLLVNVGVFIVCQAIYLFFGYKIQYIIGAYPTYSEHFHIYQLFTFLFVHSTSPNHIIANLLLFVIFVPAVEKKIGAKKLILSYFFIAWVGYAFINFSYFKKKELVEKQITALGINVEDIELDRNHKVSVRFLNNLEHSNREIVKEYNYVTSKTYGSSGALYGFVLIYVLQNYIFRKKILFSVIGLILIAFEFFEFSEKGMDFIIANYAHFGGLIAGLFLTLLFKIKNTISFNNN